MLTNRNFTNPVCSQYISNNYTYYACFNILYLFLYVYIHKKDYHDPNVQWPKAQIGSGNSKQHEQNKLNVRKKILQQEYKLLIKKLYERQ